MIRLAENSDSDAIVDLLRAELTSEEAAQVDWRAVGQRFRESASLQIFVAESNEPPHEVIGFVALSLVRTLTGAKGWIDDMAFKPQYANEQVGVALLEAAMRHGRHINLTHLYVNITRGNANARDFYQTVGFRPSNIQYLRIR
jgi:N-acetylglutamate synthase-like GNAT family acetyltransferase